MENIKERDVLNNIYENFKRENPLPLTNRETEVLSYLGLGKTNKEISKCLALSESTIKNHISSIFIKLKIKNRSQATAIAISSRLIKPDEEIAFNNQLELTKYLG